MAEHAVGTGLTQLELISKAAGYQALAFAAFSHVPQIILNYVQKPRVEGPSFPFLCWWLAGDALSIAGIIISGGLATHIIQTAWYLAGDAAIMGQMLWYRGYVPLTQRRRERKAAEHGTTRALAFPGMAVTSVGRPALPHRGVPAPPKNPPARRHSLSIAKSDAAHSHRGYKELSTGKPEPHHEHGHDELGDETESEVETEEKPQGLVRRLLTIHKDITLPFILLLLAIIMAVVWYLDTWRRKDSLPHLHHPSPPSAEDVWSMVAFLGGWAGTFCYNIPRAILIYETFVVYKSTGGFEVHMFIALICENLATGTSIWVVSRDRDYLIAQSPYITGVFCALTFDLFFCWVDWHFRNNKFPELAKPLWMTLPYTGATLQTVSKVATDLELDAQHRKQLYRAHKAHAIRSEALHRTASRRPREDYDKRRKALKKEADDLDLHRKNLDAHIESSGDEERITKHRKSAKTKGIARHAAAVGWRNYEPASPGLHV